jgi:hypothetical protein
MVPTLWVCINLLAAVRAGAGTAVSMADMCSLLRGKGDTMHYGDMTPLGEALFAEWLTEAAEGRCHHVGELVFLSECRWHDPDVVWRKLQKYNESTRRLF